MLCVLGVEPLTLVHLTSHAHRSYLLVCCYHWAGKPLGKEPWILPACEDRQSPATEGWVGLGIGREGHAIPVAGCPESRAWSGPVKAGEAMGRPPQRRGQLPGLHAGPDSRRARWPSRGLASPPLTTCCPVAPSRTLCDPQQELGSHSASFSHPPTLCKRSTSVRRPRVGFSL